MLGYAFRDAWAREHRDAVEGFLRSSAEAKRLLASSDAEWDHLTPKLGSDDPAVQAALRAGYRQGILNSFGEAERRDATRLYSILVDIGGEELVGSARTIAPGTFWLPQAE
jgi:NitT/TauT family transport system substrate-binding protein